MINTANRKRRPLEFDEGDQVLLKLQPYRQTSMANRVNQKLAARYYGPYRILRKLSPVVYKLELPDVARIHPVFHISQLKKLNGQHDVTKDLPEALAVKKQVTPHKTYWMLESRSTGSRS
ncbi:Unknown protein [Striga hermonthica]|uniref:Tf2-1-like SH3-like domain-containing protein n=1 Tax=Striga hermonthica TaxID=68872 RepID=A0A9N7RRF0_STRHE|nr:Unknown protein [Striga hermonthica]